MKAKAAAGVSPWNYDLAFCRNIGVASEVEQRLLAEKRVVIPGCGGVGSYHAQTLARLGIGRFTLADFDTYAIENFNRQAGARISTIGHEKVAVVRRDILEINPLAEIQVFKDGVTSTNVKNLLLGADLIIDSIDFFAFDAREMLLKTAQELDIPLITAAPLGMSCAFLRFDKNGMSYRDYFDFLPGDDVLTRGLKFLFGLAPAGLHRSYVDPAKIDLKNRRGPSSVVGVNLCAAIAGAEAFKQLIGRGELLSAPHFLQFDAFRCELSRGYLRGGNRRLAQQIKLYLAKRKLTGAK